VTGSGGGGGSGGKATVLRAMARLDERDIDGVLAECGPGCRWHGFGPEELDNDGWRAAIGTFLAGFGDSRFPIDAAVAEGDTVAVQHRLVGTHTGEFQGTAATGRSAVCPAIAVFRVAEDKIEDVTLHADLLGLLMQIGAVG
jgi:predicted ester cyclase